MKVINRREMLTGSLIVATTLSLLPFEPAFAQSRRTVVHWGQRVLARENRVFGLSAYSLMGGSVADHLSAPNNSQRIERFDRAQIARLLQASFEEGVNDPRTLNVDNYFLDATDLIFRAEQVVQNMLEHEESRLYWVNVNPVVLIVIIPRAAAVATGVAGSVVLALRPFVQGFAGEMGKQVASWMRGFWQGSDGG